MKNITNNEMKFVLTIFKSPETEYNSNSIAKSLGITSMGALKIAKRLEKEGIISFKDMGNAKFYRLNLENDHVRQYIKFLLQKESRESSPFLKAKFKDIKKIKNAYVAILFGSMLTKEEKSNDADLFLITDQKRFSKLKKEIESLNLINNKKYHPLYQTMDDARKNIKENDKVIFNAVKGIVIFGEDLIIDLMKNDTL